MASWTFDTTHSKASFAVKHMMVTTVRGSFEQLEGKIEYDPANPSAATVEVQIPAASIDTGVTDRDNHLRSPDFLDVANHPMLTFKSSQVEPTGGETARITGDLTIRGVTREVVIDAEFLGLQTDPFTKAQKAGFSGETKINREDYGLMWNVALEAGGVLVGKEVRIFLDVQAVLAAQPDTAAQA
jgi:polyisoprenoid-binding protein YceI